MVLVMQTVGDDNIEKILETPALVHQVTSMGDVSALVVEQPGPGAFARLLGAKAPPPIKLDKLEFAEGECADFDLDKSWHGIHYLLTGTHRGEKPPLDFLTDGGEVVGDEDLGYGPGRVFTSEQVAAIDDALKGLSRDAVAQRFDPQEMTKLDIYPGIWQREPEDDDSLGYCLDYLDEMKSFVDRAHDAGFGLIVYLC
jgi:hypothetical protein